MKRATVFAKRCSTPIHQRTYDGYGGWSNAANAQATMLGQPEIDERIRASPHLSGMGGVG